MSYRLPPANTLRFFEAAARLKGFKQAAEEIHVTPSAISHGMNTLESWLGIQLLVRSSHGLSLTEAGEGYLPEVRKALAILASATERLPGRRPAGIVSIATPPDFANRWLIPRLRGFKLRYPNIGINIDTGTQRPAGAADSLDYAIRRCSASEVQATWTSLAPEQCLPVCSPAVRATVGIGEDPFSRATLIRVTGAEYDWDVWFAQAGTARPSGSKGIYVDSVELALKAAEHGLGVALGRKPLIDGALQEGSLVDIGYRPVVSSEHYWLVAGAANRSETVVFRTWLMAEFGLDQDLPKKAALCAI